MVHSPDMENEILTQIKAFLLSDGMSNEIYILWFRFVFQKKGEPMNENNEIL